MIVVLAVLAAVAVFAACYFGANALAWATVNAGEPLADLIDAVAAALFLGFLIACFFLMFGGTP